MKLSIMFMFYNLGIVLCSLRYFAHNHIYSYHSDRQMLDTTGRHNRATQ